MANTVNITITADDLASDKIGAVEKKSKGLGETLSGMRTQLLVAGAALTGIGVASIKLASDLEEARAAAETTFKSSFGVIQQFAEDQADAFNISKASAFEYTAQLGGIFNATGLAADESAVASVEFVKLAADLASFKNLRFEEALEKIRAGLVGEAEPLRTVGVLLSAARVEQVAYAEGIAEVGAELTEQQKVQARQIIIMQDLADAQGDVDRTSDSVANRMRDVQQQLADVGATLGTQLLPATATLLGHLSDAVAWFGNLDSKMQTAIIAAGAVAAGLVALGLVIPPLTAAFGALAVAANLALAGIPAAIVAITAGITLLILKWDEVVEFMKGAGGWILAAFGPIGVAAKLVIDNWNGIVGAIEGSLNGLREIWNKIPDWLRPGPEWEAVNLSVRSMGDEAEDASYWFTDLRHSMEEMGPKLPPVEEGSKAVSNAFDKMQGSLNVLISPLNSYITKLGQVGTESSDAVADIQATTGAFDAQQRMLNNLAIEAGRARQALLDLSSVEEVSSGNNFAPTSPSPSPDPVSGGGSGSAGDSSDSGGGFSPDVYVPGSLGVIGNNASTGYFALTQTGTRIELGTENRFITLRTLDGQVIAQGTLQNLDAIY